MSNTAGELIFCLYISCVLAGGRIILACYKFDERLNCIYP